ncbi:PREDICTED: melanoma-associated antigen B6-like isoform X1 [Colobus angolensis palliatus]|uniref:MAGE domain-containing protein n=1 Tax=Colobus angolensis palliatus TaxID=336983 RepID=A0A2K5JL52_COLAP|nr:PREDICTED: melanoma-associated antigen B6-like isoform X1 [Colobus angolensis palliatus]
MPRGQKSKLRAREKRRETHGQPQDLTGPQVTAEKEEESRSSSSSSAVCRGARRRSSDSSVPQESQGASPTDSPDAGASCSKSDVAAKGKDEKSPSASRDASVSQESQGASPIGSPDAGISCSKSDVAAKGQDEKIPSTSPDASLPQESQGASPTGSPDADVSGSKSDVAAKGQEEESISPSLRTAFFTTTDRDPLNRKANKMVQFLQKKFEKKESILKADMLRHVRRQHKPCFPEILKRTSERLVVVFGVELKEMDSSGESYTLVSKLGLSSEGSLSGDNALPKSGVLMALLSLIFIKGNRATEQEVWEFLGGWAICDGILHSIYGDVRKIITEDLVQDKYVVYRQVRNSDPPRYEFLWGPRAHAETTKMRVLRVLAEINKTSPGLYPHLYEDALIDEVERALRLRV